MSIQRQIMLYLYDRLTTTRVVYRCILACWLTVPYFYCETVFIQFLTYFVSSLLRSYVSMKEEHESISLHI